MASVPTIAFTSTESQLKGAVYLGDSVYASFDGFQIKLMTINDARVGPSNTIYLDEDTLSALYGYVEKINREAQG